MPVSNEAQKALLEKEALVFDEYLALKRAGKITDVRSTLRQLLEHLPAESHKKMRRAIHMAGFLCDVVSDQPTGPDDGEPRPQIVDGTKPSTES